MTGWWPCIYILTNRLSSCIISVGHFYDNKNNMTLFVQVCAVTLGCTASMLLLHNNHTLADSLSTKWRQRFNLTILTLFLKGAFSFFFKTDPSASFTFTTILSPHWDKCVTSFSPGSVTVMIKSSLYESACVRLWVPGTSVDKTNGETILCQLIIFRALDAVADWIHSLRLCWGHCFAKARRPFK